jgi:hypothetical protein
MPPPYLFIINGPPSVRPVTYTAYPTSSSRPIIGFTYYKSFAQLKCFHSLLPSSPLIPWGSNTQAICPVFPSLLPALRAPLRLLQALVLIELNFSLIHAKRLSTVLTYKPAYPCHMYRLTFIILKGKVGFEPTHLQAIRHLQHSIR